MASTGAELVPSLADLARLTGPDGKVAGYVAELLMQSNEFIPYLYWQECNGTTTETVQQRVGLPAVYYRGMNQGIASSHSEYAAATEGTAMAQGISTIDRKILLLNAARKNFRFLEQLGFVESLSEQFAKTFFYGDTTQNPNQYMGLAPRYSTLNPANAANAQNVLSGGGSANANASMWLLNTGPRSMYGIFPKGTSAGIKHLDRGLQNITVTTGPGQAIMLAEQDVYEWDAGLALADWRWNVRMANIDANNLKSQNGAANLLELMADALYCVPSIGIPASATGNPMTEIAMKGSTFYVCPRRVRAALHKQAVARANSELSFDTIAGKKVLTFAGIPVINCDQLTLNEANVV